MTWYSIAHQQRGMSYVTEQGDYLYNVPFTKYLSLKQK